MTIISEYDSTLFKGAAWYYGEYRPKYPSILFELLTNIFHLDGKGKLLDLGCGAGLLTIPLHDQFAEVIGLDPDDEMLKVAHAQAIDAGVKNISWIHDQAENITSKLGEFHLVTIGRAFHWMDRELVIQHIHEILADDGGVAIIQTHEDPWNSQHPWKQASITVVKKWLGEQRRAGQGVWKNLGIPHATILENSSFSQQCIYEVKYIKSWTLDTYIGYLYSTAFCLPSFIGENRQEFEADMRKALLEVEPSGVFVEELPITVLAAWKHKSSLN
jgi:ubiquinone/menaquinone biosynthesis C-methylase UbiE